MKPAPFCYAKARSLKHALELLGQANGEARVLAGGQSLIAALNLRLSSPRLLVDINGLADLDTIDLDGDRLALGAMVRQAAAERSPAVIEHAPLIVQALSHVAHPAIRNRGTIGGSIALADPAAELPACLVALGGEVEIAGSAGRRRVGAEDFFKGLYETDLEPGEVLAAVRVPAATRAGRYGFGEFARRKGDYALVGLCAAARASGDKLQDVRLVFFGVGLKPVRARKAEAEIEGGPFEEGRIRKSISALADDLDPLEDIQASKALRTHLAGVLLKRVVQQLSESRS
jgi:carbon-monoxide dehydrogenase medium subunit